MQTPTPVINPIVGATATRRGSTTTVLNSPHNKKAKNTKKSLSGSEPKAELRSITDEGPKLFKVVRGRKGGKQMDVPVTASASENGKTVDTIALLDTGSTGSCVSHDFVKKNGFETWNFDEPIQVYNADGSPNSGGAIRQYTRLNLTIGDHRERLMFLVTDLGKSDMFLGFEWIEHHNPHVDWQKQDIEFAKCPDTCIRVRSMEDGNRLFMIDTNAWLRSQTETMEARARYLSAHFTRATAIDIAIEQHKNKKIKSFEELVPEQYRTFTDVFTEDMFQHLPEHRSWDHAIELVADAQPYAGKVYSMTLDEQKALDQFLEDNLKTGRIRPSKSPWGAPFFFVKKKDGKLRPVQDYRKLNDLTKKNRYPLPLISELIDKLKRAKYYTKLDIRWGYNNIRMKEGDEEKAAFIMNRGLYEPLVMFFGLTNSPATFQTMMNDIFRELILQGKVIVYLDDILIFSEDLDEHRRIVKQVLEILRKHKLTCKPDKCEFEVVETEYLGHIIGHGSVRMDPAKVAGVTDWPVPKSKRDVQQFLGFANFYRRFVKDFSKIAGPMTKLTGQAEWAWGPEQQEAFERIKTAMTSAPVLAVPNNEDPFKVECDASKYALGVELAQKQDGQWRTIAYLSKSLSPAERNYEIYDREMLAVMTALDEWRHFLMGAAHTFEIHSDHKNLEYFRKPQKLNQRQARWVTELSNYHFTLLQKPGKTMVKGDPLSRRPDHDKGDNDNTDVQLLKSHWFRANDVLGTELLKKAILKTLDNYENTIKSKILQKDKDYSQTEDGLIWRRGKIVIPADKALRGHVIAAHHDSVSAGHPGQAKTQELVYRSYWWPSIKKDVKAYVKGCTVCQRSKIHHQPKAAPLHPNPIPEHNWEYISVDMITHLPKSEGHNAILVIVGMKSKDYLAIPTTEELNSEGWIDLYIKHVWSKHGLSK